ncbi:MAG: DegT/DnrJ/EryC1/StrS family aminotransferase [Candidatus Omnitrophica bacterium]|nr:DegT/DnrJ/EryC1/StrS family aminotransferase [Candidatus Omnitrophota bacterium]
MSDLRMNKKSKIFIIDLKREFNFLKKEINQQINDCLNLQHWILGKKTEEFEKAISKYLNLKYAIGVASGTDALTISLQALALKLKGKEFFDQTDQIITTPFTFIATAEAILRAGAKIVFVDINPDTFNIDPQKIKKAITKNTVGILAVHLFGLPCAMDEIKKIACENNLFVVEDVAQAFGARFKNSLVGTFGNAGAFSFFPTKNLGCYGDGGLVATDDLRIAEFTKILRNHGQIKQYIADYIGYNSRLDTLQAAILLAKLRFVEKFNNWRKSIADRYNKALSLIKNITIPKQPEDCQHAYHLYTIKIKKNLRNKLLSFLNQNGIQARVYYPVGLHKMKAFRGAKLIEELKITEEITSSVISLPIHPFLKIEEVDYIIKTIESFFIKLK